MKQCAVDLARAPRKEVWLRVDCGMSLRSVGKNSVALRWKQAVMGAYKRKGNGLRYAINVSKCSHNVTGALLGCRIHNPKVATSRLALLVVACGQLPAISIGPQRSPLPQDTPSQNRASSAWANVEVGCSCL